MSRWEEDGKVCPTTTTFKLSSFFLPISHLRPCPLFDEEGSEAFVQFPGEALKGFLGAVSALFSLASASSLSPIPHTTTVTTTETCKGPDRAYAKTPTSSATTAVPTAVRVALDLGAGWLIQKIPEKREEGLSRLSGRAGCEHR